MADKKKGDAKPRRQRSDQERIAALEAQLEAVRNKGAIKDRKRHAVLSEQREKLVTRIDELTSKVEVIDDEVKQIEARTDVSPVAPTEE